MKTRTNLCPLQKALKGHLARPYLLPFYETDSWVNCPLSKGNQAPQPKFEIPNGKIIESNIFLFDLGQEFVRPAHLKAQ